MRRVSEVIQVLRYQEDATRDRYGNPVPGYAAPVDVGVYVVSPRQSVEEDEVGRRPIITGLTVYAPLGTVVAAHDRVIADGLTYEVEGEPAVWDGNPHSARRSHGGVQFNLVRSEG
jgi:hypothetical protein